MMLVLEEEEYNDDLDIGGGVCISTLDHSLEPAWHLQMYQLLSDLSDQIGQKKLTNLASVNAKNERDFHSYSAF